MKKLLTILAAPSVAASFLVAAGSALATPTIYIDFGDNGSIDATITDNGVGDASSLLGKITTGDMISAGLDVSVTSTTKPTTGTATDPELTTSTVTIGGSGTVAIYFSETGFGPASPGFISGFTSVSLGQGLTATYTTKAQGGTTATLPTDFLGAALTTQTINNSLTNANDTVGNIGAISAGTFSLLQKIVITQTSGTTQLQAGLEGVPDGGSTVAMLGLALVGVESFRRKRALSKALTA